MANGPSRFARPSYSMLFAPSPLPLALCILQSAIGNPKFLSSGSLLHAFGSPIAYRLTDF
jgi:hypothetical protein